MGNTFDTIGTNNESTNLNKETINYMWIDKDINETYFKLSYYDILFNEKRQCYTFNTVDEGIQKLFSLKYQEITVIISARFFPEFFEKFDQRINNTNDLKEFPFPTVVIFCFEKEKFISNLILNNNYDNNYLLNKNLIFKIFDDLVDYINGGKDENSEDLTFDEVKNLKELIIPCFYSYLIQDTTETEIDYFNNNILINFKDNNIENEKQIKGLIANLKRKNLNSKELIIKNWLRMYTIPSDFFAQMNKALRTQDENKFLYYPLIKICYEGVRNKFLHPVYKKKLFRGAVISKKELEKLKKQLENNNKIKKEKNQEFPKVIVYCRSFLSFSEKEDVAFQFVYHNKNDENTEKIMYEIQEIINEEIDENTLSNCSIRDFSRIKVEEEVLLFPLSCFEIIDIIEKEPPALEKYRIILKYLGRYGNPIREQLGDNFFEYIQKTKFSDDLIKEKITINKDFESTWIIDKEYKNKYKDLSFILNNGKDILITFNNSITIFDLFSYDEEKIFNINIVDDIKIISLIKLKNNEILFSTSNNFVQIIELVNYNKKFKIKFQVQLNFCAYNLLYVEREKNSVKKNIYKNKDNNEDDNDDDLNVDKIIFTNNNSIYCLYQTKKNLNLEELIKESNEIRILKKIPNDNIVYMSTGENEKTSINFLDLNTREKNNKTLTINKKIDNLVNVAILNDYFLIGFENIIELINYKNELKTSFILDETLTDLINFKNDEILIAVYNKGKNVSFLREIKIEYEDGKYIPYMIGEGKIYNERIKKIVEINSNYALINTKNETLLKLEKKSKANEIFQESYNKYNNKKLKTIKKEFNIPFKIEKNIIHNISSIQYKNFNNKSCSELSECLNSYILTQRESNLNHESQIEKIQQKIDSNNNKTINDNMNINNINKENINLEKKDEENIGKSLEFFFPKANTTALNINFIKRKEIKNINLMNT